MLSSTGASAAGSPVLRAAPLSPFGLRLGDVQGPRRPFVTSRARRSYPLPPQPVLPFPPPPPPSPPGILHLIFIDFPGITSLRLESRKAFMACRLGGFLWIY